MARMAGAIKLWLLGPGLTLALLLAACAGTLPTQVTEAHTWFVEVDREGGVWLGPQALRTMGLDPDPQHEAAPAVRLSWAGEQVPTLPVATAQGWGLWFFAPDRTTRYTRRTAFRLEINTPGETMRAAALPTPGGVPAGGLVSIDQAQDRRYLPQAQAEVPWFWQTLAAPNTLTYTAILTDMVPGPVTVTLDLWSHSAAPADPDHRLWLSWDGRRKGEWTWNGEGMKHLAASWEEGQSSEDHTLTVDMPGLPDAPAEVIWLDGWQVIYRRAALKSGLLLQAESGSLQVEGADGTTRLMDVTQPFAPLDLGTAPGDGVVGAVPGHRYWLEAPQDAQAPLAIRPMDEVGQDALAGVQYLALAPAEFQPSLQPLLDYRRGQGLKVAAVDPQGVYDTFGTGQPDPEAVRALVSSLPSLRYLLVVGDAASEPGGYDGQEGVLRVVTPLTRTAVLGETPADALLGRGSDGRFTVAVGRLPATSAKQVATMVGKTLAWEKRQAPPAILVLSDDEPQFSAMADEIVAGIPHGDQAQRADAADERVREAVLAALRRGPAWLSFTGHGGLRLLCDEGILTAEDGDAWQQPAVVVAWTCLAAHFIHPTQDSLAETWMRSSEGGAVAFLGPVGETTPTEQQQFAQAFYQAAGQEPRIGDAWLAALQAGGSPDVALGYVLLGDPALRLAD